MNNIGLNTIDKHKSTNAQEIAQTSQNNYHAGTTLPNPENTILAGVNLRHPLHLALPRVRSFPEEDDPRIRTRWSIQDEPNTRYNNTNAQEIAHSITQKLD